MSRLLGLLLLLPIWLFQPTQAHAQASVALYCYVSPTPPQWQPCSVANPLSVSATFSGTVSTGATASASLPSLSAGSNAIYESLSGGQYAQLIFGTTIVGTGSGAGLPVQPSTSATWAVTQSTSPWVVSNGGTFAVQAALTAASGAIASGAYSSGSIASGAYASGAFAVGSGTDGWNVVEGATADAAATTGGTGTLSAKLRLMTTQLGTIIGNQASQAVTNAGTFAVQSQPTPVTSGGLSVYNVQPAASDNHVVIKAGAGQVYKVEAFNNSATVNYVRLYNATTGFNGCNSATNLVWQALIPASTSGAGLASSWDLGMAFATGISICVTSGYAQNDTTNATASALIVSIGYK